ncbi:unnamed protein product [Rhizopus stolonifer]
MLNSIVGKKKKKKTHCTEFWKEQKRSNALSEADDNCSDAINKFLVKNSEEVLASAENLHEPTTASTTTSPSVISETPTSASATTTIASTFKIDFSNNELDLEHCMLGESDVTAIFQ